MIWLDKLLSFFGFEKVKSAVRVRWQRRTQPQSKPTPPSPISSSPIHYMMNDPTTPNLVKDVSPPTPPVKPPFQVDGYAGGGHPRGSGECYLAGNCFVTICDTLNYLNKESPRGLEKWTGTSTLSVQPKAKTGLNAFYNRKSLQFLYYSDSKVGTVYTSESSDIVAHELGHAILDAYRPEMFSVASLEIASFHEAFGDFVAMIHVMLYDEVLNHVLVDTEGDLKKPNIISRVAEQFGSAIFQLSPAGSGVDPTCLRNLVNSFQYATPGTLSKNGPFNMLAAEPHNFSRIFSGVLYDILVLIYEDLKLHGHTPLSSLQQARDTLTRYVMKAILNVPLSPKFYEAMAKTMLWADVSVNARRYHDRMQTLFAARNLSSTQLMMLSAPKCESEDLIVRKNESFSLKLGDVLLRAQSGNPLYDVEVEVPNESVFLYDADRNLYDMVSSSEEDALGAAQDFINLLNDTNAVSEDPETSFEVRDGKLQRTHFSCGCCRRSV